MAGRSSTVHGVGIGAVSRAPGSSGRSAMAMRRPADVVIEIADGTSPMSAENALRSMVVSCRNIIIAP